MQRRAATRERTAAARPQRRQYSFGDLLIVATGFVLAISLLAAVQQQTTALAGPSHFTTDAPVRVR